MRRRVLNNAAAVKRLADQLRACGEITRLSSGEHDEAETLAHALADLEEAFSIYLEELLVSLVEHQPSPQEIQDILLKMGEEFRHILYHLRDTRFYRYLDDQDRGSSFS